MKKFKNLAIFALSAAMVLSAGALLAACGDSETSSTSSGDSGETSGVDYSSYTSEDWLAEDFDSKTITYQFLGTDAYVGNPCIANLYSDGGVCAEHTGYSGTSVTAYYGTWVEEEDEDGYFLTIEIVGCYGYLASTYELGWYDRTSNEEIYTCYQESDGGYTLVMKVDLAVGAYTRDASLSGSTTITYSTLAAWEEANLVTESDSSDDESEDGTDTSTDATVLAEAEGGYTTLTFYSDGTFVHTYAYTMATLTGSGTWTYDGSVLTLTADGTEYVSTDNGDGTLSITVTTDMTYADITDTFTISADVLEALA